MTFNDKVAFRRLKDRDYRLHEFSDKLLMRKYVTDRLGGESVARLLAVSDTSLAFAEMLGPYVLKANHGSGMVSFVSEGEQLSKGQLEKANSWLATEYCWGELEWGYVNARRLLLAEEYLHSGDDDRPPTDYKFFTFNGTAELIQIDTGRHTDHRRLLMRPDWEPAEGALGYFSVPDDFDPTPPKNLSKMIAWASKIGQGLDFVRVDLYDLDHRILVGELTPYPGGGYERLRPRDLDLWLGRQWKQFGSE